MCSSSHDRGSTVFLPACARHTGELVFTVLDTPAFHWHVKLVVSEVVLESLTMEPKAGTESSFTNRKTYRNSKRSKSVFKTRCVVKSILVWVKEALGEISKAGEQRKSGEPGMTRITQPQPWGLLQPETAGARSGLLTKILQEG